MQKDASTVPADPHGKRQHVVETLNIIDKGTSVLVAHHVRSDFTAETALQALAETFSSHGLPVSLTLDRDTRLGLEHHKEATSLLLLCAFVIPLGLPCSSAMRITRVNRQHVVRRVNRQGFVKVDLYPYYISSKLAGQAVTLSIQAKEQSLQVVSPQEYRRSLPLKDLQQRALSYQEYVERMQREASTRTSFACFRQVEHSSRLSGHPSHDVGKPFPLRGRLSPTCDETKPSKRKNRRR